MKKLILLLGCVVFASCGGGGGGDNGQENNGVGAVDLSNIDISGARSLYISREPVSVSGVSISSTNAQNKLYKITDIGSEAVSYTDVNNNTSYGVSWGDPCCIMNSVDCPGCDNSHCYETIYPIAIYNVSALYTIILFGKDHGNNYYETKVGYIVRNIDGAAFNLQTQDDISGGQNNQDNCWCGFDYGLPLARSGWWWSNHWKNDNAIKTDTSANIYYIGRHKGSSSYCDGYNVIYKVTTIEGGVGKIRVTPTTDTVESFEVDKDGNVVYRSNLISGGSNTERRRVITPSNVSSDIYFDDIYSGFVYWRAADNSVYYLDGPWNDRAIYKVTPGEVNNREYYMDVDDSFHVNYYDSHLVNSGNKTLIIDASNNRKASEVYNPIDTFQQRDLSTDFSTITSVAFSSNNYYISGLDSAVQKIKRYPFSDIAAAHTPVVQSYDVYRMLIDEYENVMFTALRMSDSKKVLGFITDPYTGPVTILDASLDAELITLEQIN